MDSDIFDLRVRKDLCEFEKKMVIGNFKQRSHKDDERIYCLHIRLILMLPDMQGVLSVQRLPNVSKKIHFFS